MMTKVEEIKAKYGENTEKFAIAIMMEIYDRFGEDVATAYINREFDKLPFQII